MSSSFDALYHATCANLVECSRNDRAAYTWTQLFDVRDSKVGDKILYHVYDPFLFPSPFLRTFHTTNSFFEPFIRFELSMDLATFDERMWSNLT